MDKMTRGDWYASITALDLCLASTLSIFVTSVVADLDKEEMYLSIIKKALEAPKVGRNPFINGLYVVAETWVSSRNHPLGHSSRIRADLDVKSALAAFNEWRLGEAWERYQNAQNG